MKKNRTPDRPLPAQIDAIERCIERGEVAEAGERLARLQAAFPGFKPLKRLAFEIAWESRDMAQAVFAAWQWSEASPNSIAAFSALADSCLGEYAYLYIHAVERLRALGEQGGDEIEAAREAIDSTIGIGEEEGLRLDLCRMLMGVGKINEAGTLVETIQHPSAQNNFAQTLFSKGDIERAAKVFESVLQMSPNDSFALYRLSALRLWQSGRMAALPLAERLLALEPANVDEARHQMETAIMTDRLDQAEMAYSRALNTPWFAMAGKFSPQPVDKLHFLGALTAWRDDRRDVAMSRLETISGESGSYEEIVQQCFLSRISGDVPDWKMGEMSQWWPVTHILSLKPEKFASDSELYTRWQVPMPHPDYLIVTALNGGPGARALAISALEYLAQLDDDRREPARQALVRLLRLPCGPDSVRSQLFGWMSENQFLEEGSTLSLLVEDKVTLVQPHTYKLHEGATAEETVLDAADFGQYGKALDYIAENRTGKARQIMEQLLVRYPEYPRVMTSTATLREAEGEPFDRWAPLIRRAAEIDPGYFFAQTGLIKVLIREGRLDEARDLIKPLAEQQDLHVSEWRSLLLAQTALAQADGDLLALKRLNTMLRDCVERFG